MKHNRWIIRSFLNYFWLGIVLILFSCIIDIQYPQPALWVGVSILFLQIVGVSILVATIFSFTSGTSEFINKITELLRNIVIDRNFLGNIDADGKRNALNALIKPTEAERQLYSDIGRYYDMYINHTMGITDKCVRSDYNIQATAYFDKTKNRIRIDEYLSYRLHPTVKGYDNITIAVDDIEKQSSVANVRVTTPEGKRVYNQKPEIREVDFRGNKTGQAIIPLKELGSGCAHLKIEIELTEFGYDHWALLTFQALQPTDGFRYRISCLDKLRAVAKITFVHGAKFYVENTDGTELLFSSDEWFNEGTGLAVVRRRGRVCR